MLKAGFSLLEIWIALSIVIISAMFIFPTMQHFIVQSRADIKQAELLHAIQLAQASARSYRTPVVICKTRDGEHCGGEWRDGQLVFLDFNRDGKPDQQAILSIANAIDGELHWRSFPVKQDALQFLPNGFTNNNGTFWYCHAGFAQPFWGLVVSQSGRFRVVLPDVAGRVLDSEGNALTCNE